MKGFLNSCTKKILSGSVLIDIQTIQTQKFACLRFVKIAEL
jgi:hypothetical protein